MAMIPVPVRRESSPLVVVTADDFGYGCVRDDGILRCWESRSITRASLMVNGASAKQACHRASQAGLTIGLHLNLTEGLPVSGDVPSLLCTDNDTAMMRGKMPFRQALAENKVHLGEVKREIDAQIQLFEKLNGRLPPYIDGHQHVHVLPGVADVLAETMEQYGIRETRLPVELLTDCDWMPDKQLAFYETVSAQAEQCRHIYDKHHVRYSSGFIGMCLSGQAMSVARIKSRMLKTLDKIHADMAQAGNRHSVQQRQGSNNQELIESQQEVYLALHEEQQKQGQNQQKEQHQEKEEQLKEQNHQHQHLYQQSDLGEEQQSSASSSLGTGCVVELMVHPGYPCSTSQAAGCGAGPDDFSMSQDRQHEMDVLCSTQFAAFFDQYNLKLVSLIHRCTE